MRLIKMFGLAAIAVGAFMAFLGATSASAVTSLEEVVLCKALEDPCLNGHFGKDTVLHGRTIASPELLGLKNILCEKSTVLGTTTSLLAHGSITNLDWTNCHAEGESCTVSSVNLNYLVTTELTSNHKSYEVLVSSGGSGSPGATVACEDGTSCTYGASTVLFQVLHTGTNKLVVLDVLHELSGKGICFFTTGIWHAKYELKCLSGSSEVGCWPAMEAGGKL